MRPVTKFFPGLPNHAVDMINRKASLQNIIFRDENDIGFIQLVVAIARVRDIGIHQAAVIAGSSDLCTTVVALDLNVISPVLLIHSQNVQTSRAALNVVQAVLTMNFTNRQVITIQNHLKQHLRTALVLENLRHKVVVKQAKTPKPLQVLFMSALKIKVTFRFIVCHLFTCFLSDT